jgi:hypothetical protein
VAKDIIIIIIIIVLEVAKGNSNYVTHVMTELIALFGKIFHKYCAVVIVTSGLV